MKSFRPTLVALTAAALFAAVFALPAPKAGACGGDSACSCGAACPSAMGSGDGEKAAGSCGCMGAAAAAAAPGEQPAMGCNHAAMAAEANAKTADAPAGTAQQRAVLDPATGQLVAPAAGEPTGDIPPAINRIAVQAPVAQPGGGVMAAVPFDRSSKAVATVDDSGKVHTGCGE